MQHSGRFGLYSQLDFLQEWKDKNVKLPSNFVFPDDQPTQIYLLDKEGATQSYILMGHKSDPFDTDGNYFNPKSRVTSLWLGGEEKYISNRHKPSLAGKWEFKIEDNVFEIEFNVPEKYKKDKIK